MIDVRFLTCSRVLLKADIYDNLIDNSPVNVDGGCLFYMNMYIYMVLNFTPLTTVVLDFTSPKQKVTTCE